MHQHRGGALWDLTARAGLSDTRRVSDASGDLRLADLGHAGNFEGGVETLRDKSVLISSARQLPAVAALLQLDGIARRLLLCPPDLAPEHLPAVIAEAEVDVIVSDGTGPGSQAPDVMALIWLRDTLLPVSNSPPRRRVTEWLLLTSGTTGRPKIVVHTLASLTGPLDDGLAVANDAVWSTFYDVRRYGGLQILLRALLGGGSMVLSQAHETVSDFLMRAGRSGVTHISGTPSHWRRALMTPAYHDIQPGYVRLSGAVADQAVLNSLAAAYQHADIAHAFASTEAGVAFDVRDRLAGFPASVIGQPGAKADMRIVDGSLRIRSARTASRYLGDGKVLMDAEGFVDTGDMLELRGDRYYFVGRREGIINVGGQKVHPEEVEAVINQHPAVQMVRARARPNPITGAVIAADIVVRPSAQDIPFETIKAEILEACRRVLPRHKIPATLHSVASLEIAESGKLVRPHA